MSITGKKTDVRDLRIGMYVVELDRPWLETPFLFQGFEIRAQGEIEALRRYCQYVYVLASQPDIGGSKREAANIQLEQTLLKINNRPAGVPYYADLVSLEAEIPTAHAIYKESMILAYEYMEDARLGRGLNSRAARKVVAEMVESVIRNPDALACFAQLKSKEEYTAQHSLRVCILALTFGRHLGFDREQLNTLGIGALLHDIGKMKVPFEILTKSGSLTDSEKRIMRNHVPWGVEILERTPGIPDAAIEIARNHHERYIGSGYMRGLKGDAIGTFGLLSGIVDCYDAISSDRYYGDAISPHEALRQIYELRNQAFHPLFVEQFIQCLGIYPIGSIIELNTGEVGVVIAANRTRRLKPRVTLVLRSDHTPYAPAPIIDLTHSKTGTGQVREIERAVAHGAYRINPAQYLPIPPDARSATRLR